MHLLQVKLFKDYIPKAFPDGDDLILDSEILMIDRKTGQPLPFGSLGKHKVLHLHYRKKNTSIGLTDSTICFEFTERRI